MADIIVACDVHLIHTVGNNMEYIVPSSVFLGGGSESCIQKCWLWGEHCCGNKTQIFSYFSFLILYRISTFVGQILEDTFPCQQLSVWQNCERRKEERNRKYLVEWHDFLVMRQA